MTTTTKPLALGVFGMLYDACRRHYKEYGEPPKKWYMHPETHSSLLAELGSVYFFFPQGPGTIFGAPIELSENKAGVRMLTSKNELVDL